jgi:hypothetical protein
MEISSTLWILDITNWWCQQDDAHSKYADPANVALNIFSIIPHGVGGEASLSLWPDFIARRQSKTTGQTRQEKFVVSQFAQANNVILAGKQPELNTTITAND